MTAMIAAISAAVVGRVRHVGQQVLLMPAQVSSQVATLVLYIHVGREVALITLDAYRGGELDTRLDAILQGQKRALVGCV